MLLLVMFIVITIIMFIIATFFFGKYVYKYDDRAMSNLRGTMKIWSLISVWPKLQRIRSKKWGQFARWSDLIRIDQIFSDVADGEDQDWKVDERQEIALWRRLSRDLVPCRSEGWGSSKVGKQGLSISSLQLSPVIIQSHIFHGDEFY
jgi:hypothetical protein